MQRSSLPTEVYGSDVEVLHPALVISRPVALGAVWGVTMWSAYGLLEYFLYSVIPLFTRPGAVFTPANWRLNALIFDSYWILGALTGAVAGWLAHRWSVSSVAGMEARLDLTRLPGTLSLLLGVVLNLLTAFPLGRSAILILVMAIALGSATIWALARPKSRAAQLLQVHPVILSMLVLGPTWLSTDPLESAGLIWKGAAILLLIGGLIAVSALMRLGKAWSGSRHLITYLAVITIVTGGCAILSGAHRARATVTAPAVADPGGPPVILVSLDTTRADHLSLYGYRRPTSPRLADFAKGATLYTDAMAASDMTLASHASIFTGVYPSWHGAHPYSVDPPVVRPLDEKLPTLAGILGSKGYFTAGIAANSVFLVPKWGLNRGFQIFDVQSAIEILGFDRRFNMRHGIRRLLDCCMDTSGFDAVFRHSDEVNQYTISILEEPAIRSRSLFLFVNYMDAHAPYVSTPPYNTMFLGADKTLDYPRQKVLERDFLQNGHRLSESQRARLEAQYDGGLASQDASFGQLIDLLKSRGIYDRALIIVTADHGEAFGERGMMEHGVGVSEDQVHVPLVIKYPNQVTAAVVKQPVSHVDLLPTILDVVGYPAPTYAQGLSLRHPEELGKREIIAESFPNLFFAAWRPKLVRTERAVRAGSLKLTLSTSGKNELYDLAQDKDELHNLRALGHPAAQNLDALLRGWIRRAPSGVLPMAGKNANELRLLKGLGYVQ
jgi:arylsulfatase A-like enzyme